MRTLKTWEAGCVGVWIVPGHSGVPLISGVFLTPCCAGPSAHALLSPWRCRSEGTFTNQADRSVGGTVRAEPHLLILPGGQWGDTHKGDVRASSWPGGALDVVGKIWAEEEGRDSSQNTERNQKPLLPVLWQQVTGSLYLHFLFYRMQILIETTLRVGARIKWKN